MCNPDYMCRCYTNVINKNSFAFELLLSKRAIICTHLNLLLFNTQFTLNSLNEFSF